MKSARLYAFLRLSKLTWTYASGVYDAENPFNNSARPNSWTPPLSEPWNWSTDRIWGVNLGGLFELEPFISPELFQAHPNSVDEWTLDTDLRAGSNGSQNILAQMENYYNTFITEQDIAEIAGTCGCASVEETAIVTMVFERRCWFELG